MPIGGPAGGIFVKLHPVVPTQQPQARPPGAGVFHHQSVKVQHPLQRRLLPAHILRHRQRIEKAFTAKYAQLYGFGQNGGHHRHPVLFQLFQALPGAGARALRFGKQRRQRVQPLVVIRQHTARLRDQLRRQPGHTVQAGPVRGEASGNEDQKRAVHRGVIPGLQFRHTPFAKHTQQAVRHEPGVSAIDAFQLVKLHPCLDGKLVKDPAHLVKLRMGHPVQPHLPAAAAGIKLLQRPLDLIQGTEQPPGNPCQGEKQQGADGQEGEQPL